MTVSFNAANQAKLAIKMLCSNFAWYKSSYVEYDGDEYVVVVSASKVDDAIRKIIPQIYNDVAVKTIHCK